MQNNYKNAMKKWFSGHFFSDVIAVRIIRLPSHGLFPSNSAAKKNILYFMKFLVYLINFFITIISNNPNMVTKTNDPLHANQITLDSTD